MKKTLLSCAVLVAITFSFIGCSSPGGGTTTTTTPPNATVYVGGVNASGAAGYWYGATGSTTPTWVPCDIGGNVYSIAVVTQ